MDSLRVDNEALDFDDFQNKIEEILNEMNSLEDLQKKEK